MTFAIVVTITFGAQVPLVYVVEDWSEALRVFAHLTHFDEGRVAVHQAWVLEARP